MNDNFGNLKLLLDSDISTHPRCKHGPTLLFSREVGGGSGVVKKFYACSAYRNRKDCDFYQEAGDKVTQAKLFRLSQASKLYLASNDYTDSYNDVVKAREEKVEDSEEKENETNGAETETEVEDSEDKENEMNGAENETKESSGVLKFCQDCGRVSTPNCLIHNITNLSREDLDRPAKVLKAKSADKKEAQYFFSDSSKQFLVDTIASQGFTHVLCVGCPSVYECLPAHLSSTSLLLDLDPRFLSFYSSQKFLWYNFF